MAEAFVQEAIAVGASDIHLKEGDAPRIRGRNKKIESFAPTPMNGDMIRAILQETAGRQSIIARYDELGETDYSFTTSHGRVRVNAYRQGGQMSMAMRVIKLDIPTFEQLGLERETMEELAGLHEGLILVTGPTGSGKSTTLGSLLDYIIRSRSDNVITIEDPIELHFTSARAMVSQREVGMDTASFASGIRAALRQDPDVILVGEMRDIETIDAAMKAAQTGHLVLSTLHTQSASKTIQRIVNFYPPAEQHVIRKTLAETLRAVLSQRLIKAGSGRILIQEIMRNNSLISGMIEKGDGNIEAAMRDNPDMRTSTEHVFSLVKEGKLPLEDALEQHTEKHELKVLLRSAGLLKGQADRS